MPEIEKIECPACGAPVDPSVSECDYCGASVLVKSDGFSLRGVANIRLKRLVDDYQGKLRKDPNDPKTRELLGVAYYQMGLYRQAEKELKTARRLNPDEAEIYYFLALVTGKSKAWENLYVDRYLRKALQIAPGLKEAKGAFHLHRAAKFQSAMRGPTDWKKILKELREAEKLDPKNDEIYVQEGYAYEKIGRKREAINAYRRAVDLKTSNKQAYVRLGNLMRSSGNRREAIELFEKHLELDPDNDLVLDIVEELRGGLGYA